MKLFAILISMLCASAAIASDIVVINPLGAGGTGQLTVQYLAAGLSEKGKKAEDKNKFQIAPSDDWHNDPDTGKPSED